MIIYHLELFDGTVGTLGCHVVGNESTGCEQISYQQCYGKYNDRINTDFARSVIEQVNAVVKEKTVLSKE